MSPFGCCVLVFLFSMTKKEEEEDKCSYTSSDILSKRSYRSGKKKCFFTQFFLPDSTKTGYVSLWW